MGIKRTLSIAVVVLSLLSTAALASQSFIIKSIQFNGLNRVSRGTVLSYLPVHVGQQYNPNDADAIIKALYNTGYFSNIKLARRGDALIITVQEQPVIGDIHVTGNKTIPKDKFKKALKDNGLIEGSVLNHGKLNAIVEGLRSEYINLGHYDATVDAKVVSEPRNRVGIYINIHEGPVATIKSIKIVGNQAFSESQLLKNFNLSTSNLISWFTHSDQYSKDKLNADLNSLTNFYLDHGYYDFKITSKQVSISPDKSEVYITIHVYEGSVYHISGYRLEKVPAGREEQIAQLIHIKKGEVFSRRVIMAMNDNIAKYLADQGYAFPDVQAVPVVNHDNHTVFLNYVISQGNRIYIHEIHISGNTRTNDIVIRRAIPEMEASAFSLSRINESKRQLQNLPYLSNIEVAPVAVPGKPNQVDLNYHVKEVNAGRISVQGGYSDTEGFLYGASISEPNFMGTGKSVGLNFSSSKLATNYNFNYFNPYYTIYGIGRGFNLYYTHVTPGNVNLAAYILNGYGGSLNYVIPISEYTSLNFGAGYDHNKITLESNPPPVYVNFLNQQQRNVFNQFKLTGGWTYSDLDRIIFPTAGANQGIGLEVGLPIGNSSLNYYKTSYNFDYYHPIAGSQSFILNLHAQLGYGNGYGNTHQLPFWDNFYAGGISTLPGYQGNTIGPKDVNGNGLGGNSMAVGGINLIFPNGISEKLRTALTFNAGNVYYAGSGISSGPIRTSAGLLISWFSPFGVVNFSLAAPLNKQPGDKVEIPQFAFGGSI